MACEECGKHMMDTDNLKAWLERSKGFGPIILARAVQEAYKIIAPYWREIAEREDIVSFYCLNEQCPEPKPYLGAKSRYLNEIDFDLDDTSKTPRCDACGGETFGDIWRDR